MGIAGWCDSCGAYVWVRADWSCVNGHPASAVRAHYDTETGQPVAAPAPKPAITPAPAPVPEPTPAPESVLASETPAPVEVDASSVPAPAPGTPLALLADMLATLAQYPGYTAAYGTDTDVRIDNEIANASWGVGKKKVEYSARMKAVEGERVLYFWEMLKESGAGISLGGFDSESTSTLGGKRWGVKKEKIIGPGGVAVDYSWDYGKTRAIVESIAARHGFSVKVVLSSKKASY